jgi:hypothetical protein
MRRLLGNFFNKKFVPLYHALGRECMRLSAKKTFKRVRVIKGSDKPISYLHTESARVASHDVNRLATAGLLHWASHSCNALTNPELGFTHGR